MGTLRYPAPESCRTALGLTVHTWPAARQAGSGASPGGDPAPVLLIHGFASNTLYNWVKTGWLDPLADRGSAADAGDLGSAQSSGRTVISVDLPGHGASQDVDPAEIRSADILDDLHEIITATAQAPVALHGYSMGSRLAWQFAHDYSQDVVSLVMGGSPVSDEVYRVDAEQARAWAAGGPEPEDEATRRYVTVAASLPDQHLRHVVELRLSLAQDRYAPQEAVPSVPTLVVAGAQDPIAAGADQLAQWVRSAGAPAQYVEIPGRNHVNVLTSRDYKQAVLDFL
ncbi:alpha/beta fold hydrolase [Nesterenkonia lacusekhoensis]|uniref:Pimeloyl-ACP methyl ester carboxylesterase n=1 Tax=Nesterenkonia lacusekhoensis TaxID=150832 RepID=A0ABS4T3J2_9MICC|nr:pimeloyl-ACP methyl ester carboxylesterase [Nesterenkonia lacusekhoensis]